MSKSIQLSVIILFLFIKTYSQNDSISVRENWHFFALKEKKTVSIIDHIPATALCVILAFASITIVKAENGEVFRVLDLCNSKDYKMNQSIEITPAAKPEFNVILPYKYITSKDNSDLEYDKIILNTSWVIITK